eukprot:4469887-Pleurochrysis_carterae.AAC.1
MGGRQVFDVAAIAAKFNLADVKSKCWLVHSLTSKKPPQSLQLCPTLLETGHGDHTGHKHTHPPGWDTAAVIAEFSKPPTPAQAKRANVSGGPSRKRKQQPYRGVGRT